MPRFINPIDDPQAYDVLTVNGVDCPGIVAPGGIVGFSRDAEWDVKKGKGTKGGSETLSQLPPAEGSIKFLLWTPEHFEVWDESFRALFKYDPTKKSKDAIAVYHPTLAKNDVNAVVTKSIGPETSEGQGLWSITVELLEYLPPPKKSAVGTPKSSGGGGGSKANGTGKSDDPIADAQQAEIAALLKKAGEP